MDSAVPVRPILGPCRWAKPALRDGVCIRNSLGALFLKQGLTKFGATELKSIAETLAADFASLYPPYTPTRCRISGCAEGLRHSAFSSIPPRMGDQRGLTVSSSVDGTMGHNWWRAQPTPRDSVATDSASLCAPGAFQCAPAVAVAMVQRNAAGVWSVPRSLLSSPQDWGLGG
jgi:hypothetical protein